MPVLPPPPGLVELMATSVKVPLKSALKPSQAVIPGPSTSNTTHHNNQKKSSRSLTTVAAAQPKDRPTFARAAAASVPTVVQPLKPPLRTPTSISSQPVASTSKGYAPANSPSTSSSANTKPSTIIRTTESITSASSSSSITNAILSRAMKPPVKVLPPPKPTGPPKLLLQPGKATHTPLSVRSKTLAVLHTQLTTNYSKLPVTRRATLASEVSMRQEAEIYNKSSKATYRTVAINVLTRLKKTLMPEREQELDKVGTVNEMDTWLKERAEKVKEAKILECLRDEETLKKYMMSAEEMRIYDYLDREPELMLEGLAVWNESNGSWEGRQRECERCRKPFTVKKRGDMFEGEMEACSFHWGKMVSRQIDGVKQRILTCCHSPTTPPCTIGPHVFSHRLPMLLHASSPFTRLKSHPNPIPLVALDCELVYTVRGLSLARVTVVGSDGEVILDELVRQEEGAVLDLNTRFSGISRISELEKDAVLDMQGVKDMFYAVGIGEQTTIVGHAAENDLRALRLIHDRIIDTVQIFPHPRGPPLRLALRDLALKYLHVAIQTGGGAGSEQTGVEGEVGHSSLIDARTTLDLVKWKIRKDLKDNGEL